MQERLTRLVAALLPLEHLDIGSVTCVEHDRSVRRLAQPIAAVYPTRRRNPWSNPSRRADRHMVETLVQLSARHLAPFGSLN